MPVLLWFPVGVVLGGGVTWLWFWGRARELRRLERERIAALPLPVLAEEVRAKRAAVREAGRERSPYR